MSKKALKKSSVSLPFDSTVWLLRFAGDIAHHLVNCPLGDIRSKDVKLKGGHLSFSEYFNYLLGAIESAASMSAAFLTQSMQRDPETLTVFPWILPNKDQLFILLNLSEPWPTVPQRQGIKKQIQFAGAPGLFEDSPEKKEGEYSADYTTKLKMTSAEVQEVENEFLVAEELPPNALRLPVRTVRGTQAALSHARGTIDRFKKAFVSNITHYINGTISRKEGTKYFQDHAELYNKFIEAGVAGVRQTNRVLSNEQIIDHFFKNKLSFTLHDIFMTEGVNGLETELEQSLGLEHCTKSELEQAIHNTTNFSLYKSVNGNFHYEKRTNVECNRQSVLTCGFPVLVRGPATDPNHFPAFNKNMLESVNDVIWLTLDVCMQQSAATFEALRQFLDITLDCQSRGITHPKLEKKGGSLLTKPSVLATVVDDSNAVLARTLVNVPRHSTRLPSITTKEDWMELYDASTSYTPEEWESVYMNNMRQLKKESINMSKEEWMGFYDKRLKKYTLQEWEQKYDERNKTMETTQVPFVPKKLKGGASNKLLLFEPHENELEQEELRLVQKSRFAALRGGASSEDSASSASSVSSSSSSEPEELYFEPHENELAQEELRLVQKSRFAALRGGASSEDSASSISSISAYSEPEELYFEPHENELEQEELRLVQKSRFAALRGGASSEDSASSASSVSSAYSEPEELYFEPHENELEQEELRLVHKSRYASLRGGASSEDSASSASSVSSAYSEPEELYFEPHENELAQEELRLVHKSRYASLRGGASSEDSAYSEPEELYFEPHENELAQEELRLVHKSRFASLRGGRTSFSKKNSRNRSSKHKTKHVQEEAWSPEHVQEAWSPEHVQEAWSPEHVQEALAEYDELRSTARVLTGQPLESSPLLEPLRRGELLQGGEALLFTALGDLKQEIRRRSQFF
jgi:hypothetical protein